VNTFLRVVKKNSASSEELIETIILPDLPFDEAEKRKRRISIDQPCANCEKLSRQLDINKNSIMIYVNEEDEPYIVDKMV